MDTEELAEALMADATVPELRDLCSEHDISRERGMSKSETCVAAAEQAPAAVAEYVGEELETPDPYRASCTCGWGDTFEERGDAVQNAEAHGEECRDGHGVAGLSGLAVWSAENGCRVWTIDDGDVLTA